MSRTGHGVVSLRTVAAVVRRPGLWFTAVRQCLRMAPRGWWRRPPFLPLPPRDYLEFRLVTQYGGEFLASGGAVNPIDVVDYLEWCRNWDRKR